MIPELSKNRYNLLRKLQHKKHRDQEKLFLISGLRAVKEVVKTPDACQELIINSDQQDILFELNPRQINSIAQYTLDPKDFNALVDEKNPQGICAVLKKPPPPDPLKIRGPKLIYLDRINDPGNLGTIMRSAAWFGMDALLLSPLSADPYQLKVSRASAGNILNIPVYEEIEIKHLTELKAKGYALIGTNTDEGEELSRMDIPEKVLFLLGSEAHGLHKDLQVICEKQCYIKRFGTGESLNLANAASVIMYQIQAAQTSN